MAESVVLAEVWRGEFLECVHRGHAVISDNQGRIVASWGNPDEVILPRSSCKMLQALPLVESGASERFTLNSEHLALACASHQGATMHSARVLRWLGDLRLGESDLRCGPQLPSDRQTRIDLFSAGKAHDQTHNNCSGKHSGFLTLNCHLKGDAEYIDPSHPVQKAILAAHEEMTGETAPGYAIDGCSAPNFGCTMRGLALAAARMARPSDGMGRKRAEAANLLVEAMATHPELVAGVGRACTELMRAMNDGNVVKTGAEGVFTGILPHLGFGIAVKIEDGASRASECAIAALLVRLGLADPSHPLVLKRLHRPLKNRAGIVAAAVRPSSALYENGKTI